MEKFLKWLAEAAAEKFIKLAFTLAATGIGSIALLSFYTYIREFWERDPILTGFYSVICILSGIGIGMLIKLSKYLIFKKNLEEEAHKRAEEEAKQKRQDIEYARERVKSLSYDDKSVLKYIFENGEQIGNYESFNIMDIFSNVDDLFNPYEISENKWVVELTDFGKFCAEHSQDILDKVED